MNLEIKENINMSKLWKDPLNYSACFTGVIFLKVITFIHADSHKH